GTAVMGAPALLARVPCARRRARARSSLSIAMTAPVGPSRSARVRAKVPLPAPTSAQVPLNGPAAARKRTASAWVMAGARSGWSRSVRLPLAVHAREADTHRGKAFVHPVAESLRPSGSRCPWLQDSRGCGVLPGGSGYRTEDVWPARAVRFIVASDE